MKNYLITIIGINIQFVISTSKPLNELENFMKNVVQDQLSLYQIDSLKYANGEFIMNGHTHIVCTEIDYYKEKKWRF